MSYRDQDDDTSSGRTTQGGSVERRGNTIWWVLALAVIVVAVALAVVSLPRKSAPAEQGKADVSTSTHNAASSPVASGTPPAR